MRGRSFLSFGCVIASAIAGVAIGACSSFTSDADPLGTDAAPEGSTPPDGPIEGDASVDAASGEVFVLAEGYGMLSSIAANETSVYFGDQNKGRIHQVSLEQGGAVTTLTPVVNNAIALAVLPNGTVFWGDPGTKNIGRIGGPGGGGSTAQRTTAGPMAPLSLVIGARLTTPDDQRLVVGGLLTSAPTSAVQLYEPDTLLGVVTPAPATPLLNVFDVATYDGTIYFTDSSAAAVYITNIGGSSPAPLFTNEVDCQSIAADAEGVYWTRPGTDEVRWASAAAPSGAAQLASNQKAARSLAADTSGVYWMTADGFVRRSRRNAGPPDDFAKGFAAGFSNLYTQSIALTKKYVVWITSDGKVLRRAK